MPGDRHFQSLTTPDEQDYYGEAQARRDGQKFRVRARVVVGADGPRSAVARWMGLARPRLARAVQYEVELGRRLSTAEVYFRPAFRGGYAWLFPAGRSARVGAAFVGGGREAIAGLRSLLRELKAGGKVKGPLLSLTSGLVPVGGPATLRRENLLLVGDAAGQTHPITGAGVLNAIVGGEMAGRAAAECALTGGPNSLDEYEEECRFVLGPALERAREKRRLLESVWDSSPAELAKTIRRSWITFDEYYSR